MVCIQLLSGKGFLWLSEMDTKGMSLKEEKRFFKSSKSNLTCKVVRFAFLFFNDNGK